MIICALNPADCGSDGPQRVRGRRSLAGRRLWILGRASLATALVAPLLACVTVAEHRKLERRVVDLQRGRVAGPAGTHVADLGAEIDELRAALREQGGQLEELQQVAEQALAEARKARREAAAAAVARLGDEGARVTPDPGSGATGAAPSTPAPVAGDLLSEELKTYQDGLAAWRSRNYRDCIDRFKSFLQTYASSSRADDAAFWIADCHYRQGEFRNAVLRFDDVVRSYPTSNRAADALYRQGESLLKLGPGYHEAAKRAFERVLKEYPDSERAAEANQQLEVRGSG